MGYRICGDAFLLKINKQRCKPENSRKETKFHHVIYEDVPVELTNSDLLREIMRPLEWKISPGTNYIVKLGFERAQIRQRKEKVWREKIQRERELREFKKRRMEKMEKERQREQTNRERREKKREKKEKKEKKEKEKEERERERERERQEKEKERQEKERQEKEKERQETERQETERQETEREREGMMAYEQPEADTGEILVGLPYQ